MLVMSSSTESDSFLLFFFFYYYEADKCGTETALELNSPNLSVSTETVGAFVAAG